ncbi:Hpc2p SCDLUD_000982 [Saccharomycodes ludwigii]|nr:hypothetical protein SCDLUD_000982 [Saccharomycodes ludwigii]KAH3903353.1 hypothetical protein SCDLUD_000982 [Saccharomycodes ludwigii]
MGPKNNEIITINNNSNTPTLNNQHSKTNVSFLISEDKDTSSLPFLQLPSQLENNAFSIPGLKTQQSSSLVQKKKPENSFDAKKSNLTRNTSKTKTKTKNENSKDKGETSKSDLNNDSNNKKSENTTIQNTKIINNISTPTTAQKALATKAASFPVNSSPLIKNIQNTPKIFSSKLSTDTGNNPKNIHKYGSTSVSATPRKQQSDMTPGNNLVTKAATTVTKKDNGEYLGTPKIIKTSSLFNSNITNQNNNAEDDVNNIGNGVIVVNIPLYTTEDNNYLDENGQVVFNFTQIINDYNKKHHPKATGNKNVNAKLAGKRNLLNVLENKNNSNKNADGEDDLGELLDDELSGGDLDDLTGDDDVDDDEDADEEVNDGYHDPGNIGNSKLSKMIMGTGGNNTPNSKKQPHPNKGKSRIGKYDIDDPFIDDSELLWEEQRAATKDGFFVFSGPLIEKGHYASFERIDGTMKRGGVRSK